MTTLPRIALCAQLLWLTSAVAVLAQPAPHRDPLLRTFDVDGDGKLSASEIDAAAARLRALDANKDGTISGDELPLHGPPRGALDRGPGSQEAGASAFDNPSLAKDAAERSVLAALDQIREGPGFANVPPLDGRLLRLLAEAIAARRVVEIGTSTGESAIWIALALRSTGGRLVTHEIDPDRVRTARANFQKAGVADLVTVIEGDAHETVKQHKDPIDMLFLDADKEGYLDYLGKLLPLVRPGGLIIAHNMNRHMADPRYVQAITKNPALETAFLYMEHGGISVTLKKR